MDGVDRMAGEGGEREAFLSSEWRGPSAPAPVRASRPRRRSGGGRTPVNAGKERDRAIAIIQSAKRALLQTFDRTRDGLAPDMRVMHAIVGDVSRSVARNRFALVNLTRLRSRHEYTYVHSIGVCALMIGVARQLRLPDRVVEELGLAGLLHDIGKARVPINLLDKPGPLTNDERRVINTHSERGHAILQRVTGVSPIVLDVALHHHERYGGGGYPFGLAGDAISLHARIAAVCDVFDALTSQRAYKDGWTPAQALEWMAGARDHFDPALLPALRALIGIFPAGALVRLRSDRLAIVLDEAGDDPTSPAVCVFHCAASHHPLAPVRCDSRYDPVLGIESPAAWQFTDWDHVRDAALATIAQAPPSP